MTIDVQELITQRPHLKDPLLLYGRWLRFQQEVAPYLAKERTAMASGAPQAYPREKAEEIFALFAEIFELPADAFAPLGQALERGEVDFMRLPLGEVPAVPDLTCDDEELARVLFLLARPYFLALRSSYPLDGSEWTNGRCPLCSAQTALASIVEGPKRQLHCSFCATTGSHRFIGCPNCDSDDSSRLTTIESEDEPGFRVITCDACHTYVKVLDYSILKKMSVDLADLASLPLDIVAQEKGYRRMAPNPISLKRLG